MPRLISRFFGCRARFALALLWVALGACECDDGVQSVSPHLGPSEEAIDFGQVAVGDSVQAALGLTALTSADIEITVTLEDNEAGAFSFVGAVPEFVPGNGFADIQMSFEPPTAEVFVATLDIVANDPEAGRAHRRVLLSGDGKRAELSVTPESLELSAIACSEWETLEGCVDEATVVLKNTGLVNLTLEQIFALEKKPGGSNVPNLTLTKPMTTTRLRPGETLGVPVRWAPEPAQAQADPQARYEMVLRIVSNDADKPVWDVSIFAHAEVAPVNAPPQACVNVVGVTRLEYEYQASGLKSVVKPVAANEWWDDAEPPVLLARPGYTVTVSADSACTFDPEGAVVTPLWSVSGPDKSRAQMTSSTAVESSFTVDAAGEYEVDLVVSDPLGQKGYATLSVNAESRDDLFVELFWETDGQVDLDLHLLVDAGPRGESGSYSQASLFCEQDTFFANPNPNLFDESSVMDNPRLLRDDQGSAGALESISLEQVPDGSRFRVAVHYYEGFGAATPTLTIRFKGQSASVTGAEMATRHGTWFGAEIDFPEDGEPVLTTTEIWTLDDEFVAVGVCN